MNLKITENVYTSHGAASLGLVNVDGKVEAPRRGIQSFPTESFTLSVFQRYRDVAKTIERGIVFLYLQVSHLYSCEKRVQWSVHCLTFVRKILHTLWISVSQSPDKSKVTAISIAGFGSAAMPRRGVSRCGQRLSTEDEPWRIASTGPVSGDQLRASNCRRIAGRVASSQEPLSLSEISCSFEDHPCPRRDDRSLKSCISRTSDRSQRKSQKWRQFYSPPFTSRHSKGSNSEVARWVFH